MKMPAFLYYKEQKINVIDALAAIIEALTILIVALRQALEHSVKISVLEHMKQNKIKEFVQTILVVSCPSY
ncbi:hypothetical protein JNUCC1_02778 [Lentibacillus sp. JNUCC-1]|uniref:hypothetical protein n=1 Tax=Lentibacillus sp. JNUCC-1 TaxID=2654513 RepID=UPI0012E7A4C5|nr:hypothetical protein [Lentibacillus sp. JNUCC-1]MUV38906.1 hypothetical protein [Lentibacillus sp. JNUCC-1]